MNLSTLAKQFPGHAPDWYDTFLAGMYYMAGSLTASATVPRASINLGKSKGTVTVVSTRKPRTVATRTTAARRGRKPGVAAVLKFIQQNGPNIPELQIANGIGITPTMLSGLLNTLSVSGKITGSVQAGWTAAQPAAATNINRRRRAA